MKKLLIVVLLIAIVWLFLYINNHWLQITNYTIKSSRVPQAFHNTKIVHISDLHDATFGHEQKNLVKKVKEIKPEFIFLTGDAIDSRRYDLSNSMNAIKQLVEIAPVYYVTGNHEIATNQVTEIKTALQDVGVYVLEDEFEEIIKDNERIFIAGIEDPLTKLEYTEDDAIRLSLSKIKEQKMSDDYMLLLSHRPEFFDTYVDYDVDLTFTGHAHGGQIRIWKDVGVIAPGQGLFPKWTSGVHTEERTNMVVSRGLGNSLFPFRIFNRPEIIIVEMQSE